MTECDDQIQHDCLTAQRLLNEAWPDHPSPDAVDCYSLATRMQIVRSRGRNARPATKAAKQLAEAARKFLRAIDPVKEQRQVQLEEHGLLTAQAVEMIGPDTPLRNMEDAIRSVTAVLNTCEPTRPDAARFLADGAKETWERDGVQIKLGVKSDDPLCIFTKRALEECGIHLSEDYVSDMLRGRASRPRSGRRSSRPAEGGAKTSKKSPATT